MRAVNSKDDLRSSSTLWVAVWRGVEVKAGQGPQLRLQVCSSWQQASNSKWRSLISYRTQRRRLDSLSKLKMPLEASKSCTPSGCP